MNGDKILFAQLLPMGSPDAVFAEVRTTVGLMGPEYDTPRLHRAFAHTCALYRGDYPGYRACSTHYHDLRHTTDIFLALVRLIHGAHADGIRFPVREAEIALIAALLHDAGYIQTDEDREGTGGKYTLTHVTRSVEFMETYFDRHGFRPEEKDLCRRFILCTCIREGVDTVSFSTPPATLLGKLVATADFLGQIADRIYLEKLLFLYREFRESNLMDYESELALLRNTVAFYDSMRVRLEQRLENVQHYMRNHFRERWQIDRNLYAEAVGNNIAYLENLLEAHRDDYRSKLKREGIVALLEELETAEKG